jgi:hypothetical protein
MTTWRLWLIASTNREITSHVVEFQTKELAEDARKAVNAMDDIEAGEPGASYAFMDAVPLYLP